MIVNQKIKTHGKVKNKIHISRHQPKIKSCVSIVLLVEVYEDRQMKQVD